MKTIRLFDENGRYNNEAAIILEKEIQNKIEPVMKSYIDAGFSVRDIKDIITKATDRIALNEISGKE